MEPGDKHILPVARQRIFEAFFHFLLKRWQPVLDQVDILQDDPVSIDGCDAHALFRYYLLTLT